MKPASACSEPRPVSEHEDAALHHFLAQAGRNNVCFEGIADEGSSRRYYRVLDAAAPSAILCIDQPFREDQSDFLILSRQFRTLGLSVPGIIAHDERGWFLIEDAGSLSLDRLFATDRQAGLHAYETSLDELARWHAASAPALVASRSFDFEKLWFEMDFLFTRLRHASSLVDVDMMPDATLQMFLRETCSALANAGPRVLTHRDFHARNIMLPEPGNPGRVVFIDYQDARMGLPSYDLTSLLFDPYAELQTSERAALLQHYLERRRADGDGARAVGLAGGLYYLQALQRIFKALGSYLYLAFEKQKPAYISSILPALTRLDEIILLAHLPDGCYFYVQRFRREFLPILEGRLVADRRTQGKAPEAGDP